MISLDHLSLGYGNRALIADASTSLPPAQLTALLGRNGTGKSTLLRTLAGLAPPRSGTITIGDKALNLPPSRLVAYVGTGRVRIPNMSCRDVVGLGRAPYTDWLGRLSPADSAAVDQALDQVGMTSFAFRPLDSLSDGEAQRVMIARALAQATPVILLDEPTSFLDIPARNDLCRLLRSLAHSQGKCILFSTHELTLAQHYADRLLLIDPPSLLNLPAASPSTSQALASLFGPLDPN